MILCICPIGNCSSLSILDYYDINPSEIRIVSFSQHDSVSINEISSAFDRYSHRNKERVWGEIPVKYFNFKNNNSSWNFQKQQEERKMELDAFYHFMKDVDGIIYCISKNEITWNHPDKVIEKFAWNNKIPSLVIPVAPVTHISEKYPTELKTESICRFTYEEGRREWDLESSEINIYEYEELQFGLDYFEINIKYHNLGCITSDRLTIRSLKLPWIFKQIPNDLFDEDNIIISLIWHTTSNIGLIYNTPEYPLKNPEKVRTIRQLLKDLEDFTEFWESAIRYDIKYFPQLKKFFPPKENSNKSSGFRRW